MGGRGRRVEDANMTTYAQGMDTPVSNEPVAPTRSTLVSARGVTKTYRTGDVVVHALRGVDLDIDSGEFVVVMGPSGNGKSTLLNCLSGIDDIDDGTVMIDDQDIHAMSDRARTTHRAKRMGFVFQSFNLIPGLSAVENVELPLLAGGAKPKVARGKAMDLLGRVGLADRGSHRPNEMSGGEQQRVAVARSLVTDPSAHPPTRPQTRSSSCSTKSTVRARRWSWSPTTQVSGRAPTG